MPPDAVISSSEIMSKLTVQVHVGALHCAVAGNIGGDDRLHASFGTAAAESNARFGGDFFPAACHKAIAHVHANGNFGAVFLRHAGGKIKSFYGNGAQDAAPHAEGKISFNAGFVTDAATDLDKQPAPSLAMAYGGHVGGGVILGAVQVHHMQVLGPGGNKLPCLGGVCIVNGHLVVTPWYRRTVLPAAQISRRI